MSTVLAFLSWLYGPIRWVACLMCGNAKNKPAVELHQRSRIGGGGGFRGVNLFGTVNVREANLGGSQIQSQTPEDREDEGNG